MIKFYFHTGPNPMKVALFLEESGLDYETVPVDTRKGEQFAADFVAINPNAKTPAITDDGVRVFDSNAILLYLAEKTGRFMGPAADRAELLSWLMFVATGIGPYSGQAVHFRHYAPAGSAYGVNRYAREIERHYAVVNAHLADRSFMVGGEFTIVDMSLWGWIRALPFVLESGFAGLDHLKAWFDRINARPAAGRAEALKGQFSFKQEMDAEARRFIFPQNEPRAA